MRGRQYPGSEFWLNWHSRKASQSLSHRLSGHMLLFLEIHKLFHLRCTISKDSRLPRVFLAEVTWLVCFVLVLLDRSYWQFHEKRTWMSTDKKWSLETAQKIGGEVGTKMVAAQVQSLCESHIKRKELLKWPSLYRST